MQKESATEARRGNGRVSRVCVDFGAVFKFSHVRKEAQHGRRAQCELRRAGEPSVSQEHQGERQLWGRGIRIASYRCGSTWGKQIPLSVNIFQDRSSLCGLEHDRSHTSLDTWRQVVRWHHCPRKWCHRPLEWWCAAGAQMGVGKPDFWYHVNKIPGSHRIGTTRNPIRASN